MPPNQLPSTTNNGHVATFYASRVDKNGEYEHFKRDVPSLEKNINEDADRPDVNKIDPAHFEPIGAWGDEKLKSSMETTPFMMTWVPGKARNNVPIITHGDGIYLVDSTGKRYLDWTSQAVCSNLGHSLPKEMIEAGARQMEALPFCYGGCGLTEVRVRLNQLINEIMPGDLMGAIYPSSGAEANEAAIMMARRYTGKHKVISWYRGYHGATGNAASATGDFRRWYGKEGNSGFVKAFNPFPLFFSLSGETSDEKVKSALNMLEEQILNEGPDNIACMLMESIIGAGGCLIMPPGYMQGVRAILTKYNILMICDEVMVGFGRTGKLFGFQHYPGVLPDIVTCAKGICASSIPMSMTACRKHIMDFFEDKPLGYGSTYQAHPVAMACAYENIKYLVKNDIVGQVAQKAVIFKRYMSELAAMFPCVMQYRCVGLFGCLDVREMDGTIPRLHHKPLGEAFGEYKKVFTKVGLAGIHRYPHIHIAPPLIITEAELKKGFNLHSQAIAVLNKELGYPSEGPIPSFLDSSLSSSFQKELKLDSIEITDKEILLH